MTTKTTSLSTTAARWALGGFAATIALMAGIQTNAQAIAGHNSNAPVDYAANRIELQDRQNRVVLSGNVVIEQAGLRLTAARTLVNYSDAGSLSIQRIMATGGVVVTRGNERVESQGFNGIVGGLENYDAIDGADLMDRILDVSRSDLVSLLTTG